MADARRYLVRSVAGLLAALMIFAGLLAWQDARLAAASADKHLDTIRLAQRLVESQEARDLAVRAQLIAGNQAVVGYVTQALGGALPGTDIDRSSIIDLLEERRDQLGLAVAAVLDSQGNLVATTERFSATREFGKQPLFLEARAAQALRSGLWVDGSRLLHIAILPLASYGSGDAYLVVGTPIGQQFAKTIAEIGATDVALLASTPEGRVVVAGTLDPDQVTVLQAALPATSGSKEERLRIDLDGHRRSASVAPLFGSSAVRLVALVSPSRDAASFSAVRLPMLLGGTMAWLSLVMGLWLLWSRLLEPAAVLAKVMERAADTGDTHLSVPPRGVQAIARLATAFNGLLARLSK